MSHRSHATRTLFAVLLTCALAAGAAWAQGGSGAAGDGGHAAAGGSAAAPAGTVSAPATPAPGAGIAGPTAIGMTGSDPAALADRAVQTWLKRSPIAIQDLARLDTPQLCQALPDMIAHPAPQPGTQVHLNDRQEQPAPDAQHKRFTYSAVRPGNQLDVVEVDLSRQGSGWKVDKVGYRHNVQPGAVRSWLQGRTASWIFIAFTLLILYGLVTRSPLRRWLSEGWSNIRQHRRLVIGTFVFLYAMFALGALVGSSLPKECETAVVSVVKTAVTSVGATQAYGSGDIVRAAVTTYYQNFVVVTLSVTFTLALLLGVPAYLLSAGSYFVQGIPFGLIGTASTLQLVLVLILLLIELSSYFIVVAGGGMFLVTLVRRGLGALPDAFRKLASMLPFAMVMLLLGAWYEAFVVLRLGG
ncbi:MAG TPA: hypothetical protein VKB31_08150 [Trueperaceae bacterium]|nr:hypothetical protein [Trueperaceae bacterium]